jgi:hypothetical protein
MGSVDEFVKEQRDSYRTHTFTPHCPLHMPLRLSLRLRRPSQHSAVAFSGRGVQLI